MTRKTIRQWVWVGAILLFTGMQASRLRADAGVLLPRDQQAPDAAVLSLAEMKVEIVIDNGDARIRITQIFQNHTDRIEEGTYVFALPDRSTVGAETGGRGV
jgi:Ca-activated chloride channel family protein